MRILDEDTNNSLRSVTLLLTQVEARELRDALEDCFTSPQKDIHAHISDSEYLREITVAIYDTGDLSQLNERMKKLAVFDE